MRRHKKKVLNSLSCFSGPLSRRGGEGAARVPQPKEERKRKVSTSKDNRKRKKKRERKMKMEKQLRRINECRYCCCYCCCSFFPSYLLMPAFLLFLVTVSSAMPNLTYRCRRTPSKKKKFLPGSRLANLNSHTAVEQRLHRVDNIRRKSSLPSRPPLTPTLCGRP